MRRFIPAPTALVLILLAFVSAWAQIASTQTVRVARAFPPHTTRIVEILLSPDGSRIAARSADKTLRITDSKTGEAQVTITGLGQSESLRQWSPGGQSLVTTDYTTKVVQLWDATTGQLIHTLDESAECAFSHDGKTIITTWHGKPRNFFDELTGELKFWDVASGQLQFKIERVFKSAWSLNLAPDHRRLLVFGVGSRNKMRLIDLNQRKLLAELPVSGCVYDELFGSGGCEPVVFSPGGKILMTQSKGDIKLWDARTGKLIVDINEARTPVAFSPDGRFLTTASKDRKSVLLWEVNDQ